MNEKLSAAWVQNIKEAQEQDRLRAEAERQGTIAGTVMVGSQGGKYWKELISELRSHAIDCKVIGIRIDLSVTQDKGSDRETAVSIEAAAGFPSPYFAAVHISYQAGAKTILVKKISGADLAGKIEPIPFAASPTGELSLYHYGDCLSPTAFAKAILRALIDSLLHPPISLSEDQIKID
jgi:hypothetical protein